ncbi:GD17285 [Drosophila simulans]|uniref:GD17285 n=1 Tax=Drosophila simulans TaxID=7240 RepID=B4R5U0_DROSI|nr:GD17285 [Drosophila simulans]
MCDGAAATATTTTAVAAAVATTTASVALEATATQPGTTTTTTAVATASAGTTSPEAAIPTAAIATSAKHSNSERSARQNCCRLCIAPQTECISIINSYAADKEPLSTKILNCVGIKIPNGQWKDEAVATPVRWTEWKSEVTDDAE